MHPTTVRRLVILALAVALTSLALNLYLLAQLRRPERWAGAAVERLVRDLGGEDGTFRYTVRIPAGTPLQFAFPLNERFTIAVDTIIPINTRVRVPIRSPVGNYSVAVPLRANVPLRTRLPLHVRHTFRLRTRTTQEIAVPLEIRVDELVR